MSAPDFQAEARELNTTLTQLRVLRAMPGDCEARIAAALRAAYEAGAAKEREACAKIAASAARTDTGWWQMLARHSAEVRFVRGRLAFKAPDGRNQSATFPSSVIILAAGLEQVEHEGVALPFMALWDVPADVRR